MGPWLYNEFTKISTAYASVVVTIGHWEELTRFAKKVTGTTKWIARRIGDRRKHMNVFELPQVLKDVVQMCNDVKAAESVLAPQFPQLVADAERIKTDVEKLLGINDIAAPMAPPPAA